MAEPDYVSAIPSQETDPTTTPEWYCGFLAATEWRFVRGNYAVAGAAMAWTRLRYPLIADEAITPAHDSKRLLKKEKRQASKKRDRKKAAAIVVEETNESSPSSASASSS